MKPAFDYIIAPSMIHADIIVPHGGASEVGINLVSTAGPMGIHVTDGLDVLERDH